MSRSLRASNPQSYGIPSVFLELEDDFKKTGKLIKATKKKEGMNEKSKKKKKVSSDEGEEESEEEEIDQLADSFIDEEEEDDSDDYSRSSSTQKRNKGQGNEKKGRKKMKYQGKEWFALLPEEIVVEILNHVDHRSLYHLSRLSKRLMRILDYSNEDDQEEMTTIEKVWKHARERASLPEVSDMNEVQIAHLVHGNECFFCESREGKGDPWLRLILCIPCRKKHLVSTVAVRASARGIVSNADRCCWKTGLGPTRVETLTGYYLDTDLNLQSDKIENRRQDDTNNAENDIWKTLQGKDRQRKMAVPEYKEKSSSLRASKGMGKREKRYVERREKIVKEAYNEGETLYSAIRRFGKSLEVNVSANSESRRTAIQQRVLQLEGYFQEEDFSDSFNNHALVINGPDVIDDEAWKLLKPDILKLIKHDRNVRKSRILRERYRERLASLRRSYDKMRNEVTFFPLFADFALLPSMQRVLNDDPQAKKISRQQLQAEVDDLDEDINDWMIESRVEAIKLILTRTLDIGEDEELDTDTEAYNDTSFDDGFFNLLTSSLCCDIPGCHPLFFGSFMDLLAHQHDAHSNFAPSKSHKGTPTFRFSLPLEVATAVTALIELGELDEKTATPADVDRYLQGKTLRWENLPNGGKGKRETDWRKVIGRIKVESDKAHRTNTCFIPTLCVEG